MNRKEQLKTVLMAVAVVSLTACSEKKAERQVEPVAVETEQVVTAVFGIITLMGMIMRNEILIFEHADGLLNQGWTARDAAFDAGRRRMVPIFLTTATTAMGVVPMIIAATSFWMPVGDGSQSDARLICHILLSEVAAHPVILEPLTKQTYKLWRRIFIKVCHHLMF